MADALRPDIRAKLRHRIEANELAVRGFDVELGNAVGILLILWVQLDQDFVLIVRRIDSGDPARTVPVSKGIFYLVRRDAQSGGFVAINEDVDLWIADLQIASHIL